MALAAVEGILDSSRARIAAGQAVAPAAEALAPGPPSMVYVSPSESRRTAPAEGSMEGRKSSNCSEGRTQDARETVGELRGMVREKLGLLTAEGAMDAQRILPESTEKEEEEL